MDIKNIIRTKRLELNLTYEDLGDMVGVGKSTVRKWETGMIENIKRDNIVALAKALNISPAIIMGWDVEENKKNDLVKLNVSSDFISIPLVGSIRAGQPMLAEDNLQGYIPIIKNSLKSDAMYFCLKVKGDSMNLEFGEGTILVIEKTPCIENGEIGVIRIDGLEATVKKVVLSNEMITLIPMSNNVEHVPHMYHFKNDDIEIIGRVTQAIKTY